MIRSMTGFGRSEITKNDKKISVELKSVNHKYLDVNIRMPRVFGPFEADIKNLLRNFASRGKIDIFISFDDLSKTTRILKYNSKLASQYLNYYREISAELSLSGDISAYTIAKSPEVLTFEDEDPDEEEIWGILKEVLEDAFFKFKSSREKEGESLKINISEKLGMMGELVDFIETKVPEIIENYKLKLTEKVKELLLSSHIDDSRIAAEVTIYADKTAIDEEIVRLKAHISHMSDVLEAGGDVGRNLDFIAQEMNREANTVLSKSDNLEITNCGIELKTCIEKIREQVQNIE